MANCEVEAASGRVIRANRCCHTLWGADPAPAAGGSWLERIHPEDRARTRAEAAASLEQMRGSFALDVRFVHRNGNVTPVHLTGTLLPDPAGGAPRLLLSASASTSRQEAEVALQESRNQNEFLASIIRNASQAVAIGYGDGRLGLVNRAFEELTGYTAEEIARVGWMDMTPPEWLAAEREKLAGQLQTGLPIRYEKEYWRKDGSRVPVELFVHVVLDAAGNPEYYFSFIADISERKRSENALRASEQRLRAQERELRALTTNIPDLIARFDRGLRHIFVNAAVSRLRGLGPEFFLGKRGSELLPPPELGRLWEEKIEMTFVSGQAQELSFALDTPTGERRFESRLIPEINADGSIEHVLSITRDVTETWFVARELARAKEEAETANAAKDHFLAVLSHELRTPLAPVRLAISFWEDQAARLPADFIDDLRMIRRNIDLECRLIDDLLDLNRITRGKLDFLVSRIRLPDEVRHALQSVQGDVAGKSLEVVFAPEGEDATVLGDPTRIQQILWNLLKNAVKFTPPGGRVTVRLFNPSRGRVAVSVADTGAGITPEAMGTIFQAFEQGGPQVTRQFGGLGLGLAISKVLVEMHGGTLSAQSEGKGRGATFTVELATAGATVPADLARVAPAAPAPSAGIPATAGPHILLVEDHLDTARVLSRLLRARSYRVTTAGSVADGIAAFVRHEFDVVVSDIGLPDGTGHELMRAVLAHRRVPGVALTGYGMEDDRRKSEEAGFSAHLTKPVNPAQLEAMIARLLMASRNPGADSAHG